MAYPTDPRNPAGGNDSTFVDAHLTAEEAERLAATFRPSWELDQAPFTGPGNLSDADLHALRGDGPHAADERAAVQALNGTHAPAPATVLHEPQSSVIIDPAVVARVAAPVGPPLQTRTVVLPAHADPRLGIPAMARPATTVIMPRAPVVSLDASELEFAKRSKTGLWIGLGAAAVVVVGVGIWLASSSGDKQAAPIPSVQKTQVTAESRVPAPSRPPETVAAPQPPPAPAPAAPPAATVAAAVVATPPPAPAAPPTPPPRLVVPPAPRPPTWSPPPAARPAARPKGGATIVRDAPF